MPESGYLCASVRWLENISITGWWPAIATQCRIKDRAHSVVTLITAESSVAMAYNVAVLTRRPSRFR
jgi:hypothetical protein